MKLLLRNTQLFVILVYNYITLLKCPKASRYLLWSLCGQPSKTTNVIKIRLLFTSRSSWEMLRLKTFPEVLCRPSLHGHARLSCTPSYSTSQTWWSTHAEQFTTWANAKLETRERTERNPLTGSQIRTDQEALFIWLIFIIISNIFIFIRILNYLIQVMLIYLFLVVTYW